MVLPQLLSLTGYPRSSLQRNCQGESRCGERDGPSHRGRETSPGRESRMAVSLQIFVIISAYSTLFTTFGRIVLTAEISKVETLPVLTPQLQLAADSRLSQRVSLRALEAREGDRVELILVEFASRSKVKLFRGLGRFREGLFPSDVDVRGINVGLSEVRELILGDLRKLRDLALGLNGPLAGLLALERHSCALSRVQVEVADLLHDLQNCLLQRWLVELRAELVGLKGFFLKPGDELVLPGGLVCRLVGGLIFGLRGD